jgi:hypothetical protein
MEESGVRQSALPVVPRLPGFRTAITYDDLRNSSPLWVTSRHPCNPLFWSESVESGRNVRSPAKAPAGRDSDTAPHGPFLGPVVAIKTAGAGREGSSRFDSFYEDSSLCHPAIVAVSFVASERDVASRSLIRLFSR